MWRDKKKVYNGYTCIINSKVLAREKVLKFNYPYFQLFFKFNINGGENIFLLALILFNGISAAFEYILSPCYIPTAYLPIAVLVGAIATSIQPSCENI